LSMTPTNAKCDCLDYCSPLFFVRCILKWRGACHSLFYFSWPVTFELFPIRKWQNAITFLIDTRWSRAHQNSFESCLLYGNDNMPSLFWSTKDDSEPKFFWKFLRNLIYFGNIYIYIYIYWFIKIFRCTW